MNDAYNTYVPVVGRLLLALMFILSGFGKLGNIEGTAAFIASGGLPMPTVLAAAVGALELFGGLALDQADTLDPTLTVAASVVFHAFWAAPAEQQYVAQLLFMKNISVAGGMLLISALGAGPLSIDARIAAGTGTRFKPALAGNA